MVIEMWFVPARPWKVMRKESEQIDDLYTKERGDTLTSMDFVSKEVEEANDQFEISDTSSETGDNNMFSQDILAMMASIR